MVRTLATVSAATILAIGPGESAAAAPAQDPGPRPTGGFEVVLQGGQPIACAPGMVYLIDAEGNLACVAGIGMTASPNPTPPGGTVNFFATCNAETDGWDNLGHSWWNSISFSMTVNSSFTWTAYCLLGGTVSSSLGIVVEDQPPPPPGGEVPAPITGPSISGTAAVGQTLTANPGSWTNSPTRFEYSWKRSGDLAQLGTGSTLALTTAHAGYQIRVDVRGCNGTGCGTWVSSGWTATVTQPPPDSDGDGIPDASDNCPSYYSTDNRCESDPGGSGAEEGGTLAWQQSASASCRNRWYARVQRNIFGQPLWKYRLDIEWCWTKSSVTSVSVRIVPELHAICCWYWRGTNIYDVAGTSNDVTYYGNWGRSSFDVFTQGIFEWCMPKSVGCIQQQLPWIRFIAYKGGNYSQQGGGH